MKVGVALLPITPNKPGREFTLPFPTPLGSAGLEILVSKKKNISIREHRTSPIEF